MRCLAVLASCVLAVPVSHADSAGAPTTVLGGKLELGAAYDRLLARPHPNYWLPAVENALAVTGGLVWYWLDRERQVGDWDFPSLEKRLTFEAWAFDNNPFPINFAWHTFDGAQYHLFARSNDLSMPVAVGYGLMTSLAWEFGVEFRENVSINDMIVTTAAGTVLGEAQHWLGRYFESAPSPRWWHAIPRWVVTTNRAANDELRGIKRLRAGTTPDHLGFSSDIWHRFLLSTGVASSWLEGDIRDMGSQRPTLLRLSATSELAGIPGFLTAADLSRTFGSANVNTVTLQLDIGDNEFGLDIYGDALLVGHHWQSLPAGRAGSATTIGIDLAYRYRRELMGPYVERLAQTHLPGIGVDQYVRTDVAYMPLWVRARVRANYDFAGVHAQAYHTWRAGQSNDVNEKSILRKHGYYYGWGPSARMDLELTLPNLSIGGSLGLARYESIEGYDRGQDTLTMDVRAHDRFVDTAAWLRAGSTDRRAFVEARLERHDREGSVGDVDQGTTRSTFLISFGTEQ